MERSHSAPRKDNVFELSMNDRVPENASDFIIRAFEQSLVPCPGISPKVEDVDVSVPFLHPPADRLSEQDLVHNVVPCAPKAQDPDDFNDPSVEEIYEHDLLENSIKEEMASDSEDMGMYWEDPTQENDTMPENVNDTSIEILEEDTCSLSSMLNENKPGGDETHDEDNGNEVNLNGDDAAHQAAVARIRHLFFNTLRNYRDLDNNNQNMLVENESDDEDNGIEDNNHNRDDAAQQAAIARIRHFFFNTLRNRYARANNNQNMFFENESDDENSGIEDNDLNEDVPVHEIADDDTNRFCLNSPNTMRNHYDLANDNQNILVENESDDENNGIETIDLTGDVPVNEIADDDTNRFSFNSPNTLRNYRDLANNNQNMLVENESDDEDNGIETIDLTEEDADDDTNRFSFNSSNTLRNYRDLDNNNQNMLVENESDDEDNGIEDNDLDGDDAYQAAVARIRHFFFNALRNRYARANNNQNMFFENESDDENSGIEDNDRNEDVPVHGIADDDTNRFCFNSSNTWRNYRDLANNNQNMLVENESDDENNAIETIDLTGEDADDDTNRFSVNSSNALRSHYDLANDNQNMLVVNESDDENNGIVTIDLTGDVPVNEIADNDTNRFSFNSSNTLRNHYDLANDNQNMLVDNESDDENNGIETIDLTGDVPVHELADENPMETALDIENRENVRDSDNIANPIRYRTVTTILMLPGGERKFITSEEPELNLL